MSTDQACGLRSTLLRHECGMSPHSLNTDVLGNFFLWHCDCEIHLFVWNKMHPDYAQRSHLPAVLPTHTTHKSKFYGYILARVLSNNTQMAFAVAKIESPSQKHWLLPIDCIEKMDVATTTSPVGLWSLNINILAFWSPNWQQEGCKPVILPNSVRKELSSGWRVQCTDTYQHEVGQSYHPQVWDSFLELGVWKLGVATRRGSFPPFGHLQLPKFTKWTFLQYDDKLSKNMFMEIKVWSQLHVYLVKNKAIRYLTNAEVRASWLVCIKH